MPHRSAAPDRRPRSNVPSGPPPARMGISPMAMTTFIRLSSESCKQAPRHKGTNARRETQMRFPSVSFSARPSPLSFLPHRNPHRHRLDRADPRDVSASIQFHQRQPKHRSGAKPGQRFISQARASAVGLQERRGVLFYWIPATDREMMAIGSRKPLAKPPMPQRIPRSKSGSDWCLIRKVYRCPKAWASNWRTIPPRLPARPAL